MIKEAIAKLINGGSLSFDETKAVFEEIFTNKATNSQISAFLVALTIKKETEEEIKAAATFVREKAIKIKIKETFMGIETDEPIIDTCGTGGSGLGKFNISTATAFVVASLGIKVAKHGNRGMSSKCGSADVLEELGIKIDVPVEVMQEAIKKIGIGFLYAPLYHPALREVALIRREIGIKTIFNIIGPLCNPADITHQLLGVYREDLVKVVAGVLMNLGIKKAFVIHSKDLKDEISLSGKTIVSFLHNKKIENFYLTPSIFGLKRVDPKEIVVSDVCESAKIIKEILQGKEILARNFVLASSSVCFYILGKVRSFKEGVKLASQLIDEGKPMAKLNALRDFTRSYKEQ